MISLIVNGIERLPAALAAESKRQVRAMEIAIRVEGFRLRKLMKADIRSGAPGGRRMARLSMIRRVGRASVKTGRLAADQPLATLAKTVGYRVTRNPFQMAVGFVESAASSVTWRRLAKMHQEGFDTSADAIMPGMRSMTVRQYLTRQGSKVNFALYGRRKALRRNVFFLRKSTHTLKTPARPIIDPFWAAHRREVMANIRRNFRLKLQGKRI